MSQQITIPAATNGAPGVYSQTFAAAGFSVQQSTGTFTLQLPGSAPQTVAVGQSVGKLVGPALGSVQFSNAGSTAIQVTLGDFGVNQVTATQAAAPSFVGPNSGAYNLGSAVSPSGLVLPGVNSSGQHRKVIKVTNFGRNTVGGATNTNWIAAYVVGQAGGVVWAIPPDSTDYLETDATLLLFAIAADLSTQPANSMATVVEIFYSQSLATNQ